MKQLFLILVCLLPLNMYAQFDDIYFVPKKSDASAKAVSESNVASQAILGESYALRDEDEYNRRPSSDAYSYGEVEEYTEADEEVYDEEDFRYSTRIIRFHSPRRVVVSSPWYWDVVYSGGFDTWTVYDNGIYVDLYPSYDYWYTPYWSLSFYGGWLGFTAASYWNSWYHHSHWHYHPHWHHAWHGPHFPHYGHGFVGGYYPNRRPVFGDMRTASGNIGRPFGSSAGRGTTLKRGTVSSSERGTAVRRGTVSSGERGTAVKRGTVSSSERGTAVKRGTTSSSERGTAVKRGTTSSSERATTVKRGTTSSSERTTTVRRSSNDDSKTYNRPSSTRSTSRSSSVSRSSSSSVSRSSGSTSRSSGSSSRSSGSSRGGRR